MQGAMQTPRPWDVSVPALLVLHLAVPPPRPVCGDARESKDHCPRRDCQPLKTTDTSPNASRGHPKIDLGTGIMQGKSSEEDVLTPEWESYGGPVRGDRSGAEAKGQI